MWKNPNLFNHGIILSLGRLIGLGVRTSILHCASLSDAPCSLLALLHSTSLKINSLYTTSMVILYLPEKLTKVPTTPK